MECGFTHIYMYVILLIAINNVQVQYHSNTMSALPTFQQVITATITQQYDVPLRYTFFNKPWSHMRVYYTTLCHFHIYTLVVHFI